MEESSCVFVHFHAVSATLFVRLFATLFARDAILRFCPPVHLGRWLLLCFSPSSVCLSAASSGVGWYHWVLLAVVVVEVVVVVGVEVVVDVLVVCLTAIKCARIAMQTVQAFIIAHYCIIAIIWTSTLCCRCGHKSFFCFQMFAWSQVYKVPRSGSTDLKSARSKNLWIHQQIWCKSQITLQESETAINLQIYIWHYSVRITTAVICLGSV